MARKKRKTLKLKKRNKMREREKEREKEIDSVKLTTDEEGREREKMLARAVCFVHVD